MEGSCQDRVAVLGGGAAGLTAAYELTKPEYEDRFDVTVYTLGWRLGGKGASGRDATRGDRIEEHGLHMWFGFYRNAFRMMRDVYANVDRRKWPSDFKSVGDAFMGCDEMLLWDRAGTKWESLRMFMPPVNGAPWDDEGALPTFWDLVTEAVERILDSIRRVPKLEPKGTGIPRTTTKALTDARNLATDNSGESPVPADMKLLTRLLEAAKAGMEQRWGRAAIRVRPRLRMAYAAVDLMAAGARGFEANDVFRQGLDALNEYDLIEFFGKYGADKELTLGATFQECTPMLRAIYDVAFLFRDGNPNKPSAAAGTALNDLLRLLFGYRGSLYYKMRAGMGDAIFAPLYQMLERRGVKFRFFTAVDKLHLDHRHSRIESIDLIEQARLKSEYQPLRKVNGIWCWPSQPFWSQLDETEEPEARFETELDPLGRGHAKPLRRGADFDHVVLAIPAGALDAVAAELIEAQPQRFGAMVENAATVATQAVQVWMNKPSSALNPKSHQRNVCSTYLEPLDTYCDMSHLIERENWHSTDVKTIGYFCGVMPDPPRGPKLKTGAARKLVGTSAHAFLESEGPSLWPGARQGSSFTAIDWGIFVTDPVDPDPFASQYWRANVAPWERYVTTPAGSIKYRLPAGQSGFENLVLAGDWTKNGIDGGCVEAAVLSGMQAAHAVVHPGGPGLTDDPGDKWLNPPGLNLALGETADLPSYIEFGLMTSSGGPFDCRQSEMRAYVLKADKCRIERLIKRALNDVVQSDVVYKPILDEHVLLLMGSNLVSSQSPPWSAYGAVGETLASIWIPLRAHREGHLPELRMFISHILVNNPISLYAGRELFGYPKAMGSFSPENGMHRGGHPTPITVEAFGGDVGDAIASWRPLLEVTPVDHIPLRGLHVPHFPQVPRIVNRIRKLGAGAVVHMVFLKQFRDAADHHKACYQAVIDAPTRMTKFDLKRPFRPQHRTWHVEVHPMDSHPLAKEIGLESQTTSVTWEVAFEFEVLPGQEV